MYGAPIADVHVHVHVHVLRKMFFRLVTSVGQKKNSESPQGIEPQTFRFVLRCSTLYYQHC